MGRAMRVLITGAAGFLGRWFVLHHLMQGDEVYGVDNRSNPHSSWPDELDPSMRFTTDAGNWFHDAGYIERFDLAYHFAAPVGGRLKIEGDPLFNADSLRLDSEFFRWAINHVDTAIYPSSSAVYGVSLQTGAGHLLHEGMFHPGNPNWLAPDEMYGFTKLVGEKLAWTAETYGLNTLCIRPFSGYGEGQSSEYPIPSILARARAKENPLTVWGSGQQARDFIHVEDLVKATVARVTAGVSGYQSMNISTGNATTFLQVAAIAAQLVGYSPDIVTDESKPQGVSNRRGDANRMHRYYHPTITLEKGLCRVLGSL